MIVQRNPARSALFFAVVVLNVCGLFLLLAAPFLMGATIIIYAGAIIVTFLFIIMLSQQAHQSGANDRSREPSLAAAVGFVLLGALLVVLQRTWWMQDVDRLIRETDQFPNRQLGFKDPAEAEPYLSEVGRVRDRLGYGAIEIPSGEFHAKDSDPVEDLRNALGTNLPAFPAPNGKKESLPNLDEVTRAAAQIRYELSYLKAVRQGRITPEIKGLTLSPHGQSLPVRANDDPALVEPHRLPNANIAALGRTLFTDHLIAVELGGTLLLIATIGAIAIAGARSENAS
jgi:NADH:ubiquinone oxidoreductase subunit 6 (subunit J)